MAVAPQYACATDVAETQPEMIKRLCRLSRTSVLQTVVAVAIVAPKTAIAMPYFNQ
jgi:hypothetical protein